MDALRKPTRKQPTLHRATCDEIRRSPRARSHWTTGRRVKACAAIPEELLEWSTRELSEPLCCQKCHPDSPSAEPAPSTNGRGHLTRLGREVVDYVTEIAVIHLDNGDRPYRLTAGDIAQCLNKSPAQLTAVLTRLVEEGYLYLEDGEDGIERACDEPAGPGVRVYPAARSFRTLPFYAAAPNAVIEAELCRLKQPERAGEMSNE